MADRPSRGLADVVAASTALSDIDGRAGSALLPRLRHPRARRPGKLRGDRLPAPARHAARSRGSWPATGRSSPRAGSSARWRRPTCRRSPRHQAPMEALRSLVSLASADDPDADSNAPAANLRKAARLTAQQPILIAGLLRRAHWPGALAGRAGARPGGQLPAPTHRRSRPARGRPRSSTPAWCCTPTTR